MFANEAELLSLYQTNDFDKGADAIARRCQSRCRDTQRKRCVVLGGDKATAVPASPVKQVMDTTGAGDLFAAGFLFSLVRGFSHESSSRLGALAAAK